MAVVVVVNGESWLIFPIGFTNPLNVFFISFIERISNGPICDQIWEDFYELLARRFTGGTFCLSSSSSTSSSSSVVVVVVVVCNASSLTVFQLQTFVWDSVVVFILTLILIPVYSHLERRFFHSVNLEREGAFILDGSCLPYPSIIFAAKPGLASRDECLYERFLKHKTVTKSASTTGTSLTGNLYAFWTSSSSSSYIYKYEPKEKERFEKLLYNQKPRAKGWDQFDLDLDLGGFKRL